MSEKSMELSGRAASFARRRLRTAVMELEDSFFRTIFVITFALLPRGLAHGDDANGLFAGAAPYRVGYQQQCNTSHEAQGLPSQFTALDTVRFDQGEGIGEDQHGV